MMNLFLLSLISLVSQVHGFNVIASNVRYCQTTALAAEVSTRRSVLSNAAKSSIWLATTLGSITSYPLDANAVVGTLPEFADTNSVLQSVTIQVGDQAQKQSMIEFLKDGFDFKVLREQKNGSIEDIWMGFGPEQMSVPNDFVVPVSSFAMNGGHASIHIRYDSESKEALYKPGDPVPGNNIAYLQIGVPAYRISQMVKNGGDIISAYGFVDVVSPSGLPMRAIIGISPDPMMFIAINCQNMKESRKFYEQIGFVEQPYPYARPSNGKGQFEPPQPKNSVYLSPTKNGMGILLLQATKSRKAVQPNPVVQSLNIVYQPSEGTVADVDSGAMKISDLSGVPLAFESIKVFEDIELKTRIK
jgi:hypothetical protein